MSAIWQKVTPNLAMQQTRREPACLFKRSAAARC
jgi:hypothetical protein